MKCPTDGTMLAIAERNGVEIDYCPDCRGVWLDRGELDKILERASALDAAPGRGPVPTPSPAYQDARRFDGSRASGEYQDTRSQDPRYQARPAKKKNWLSEMLEFD